MYAQAHALPPIIDCEGILEKYGNRGDRKLFGRKYFITVIKRDPRFPTPIKGRSRGEKQLFNDDEVYEYFCRIAKEGFPE